MSTQSQASLRQAMAAATTGEERNRLAAELAAADRAATEHKQAQASLDWAATAVDATFTPVAVYSHHTAASDWLGDIPEPTAYSLASRRLIAEASLWYARLPEPVKTDPAELTAQARGAARRAASRLGMHPGAAVEPFLDYISFLHKHAGSGLPQIDQTFDANNAPAPTPYPAQVFDNFAPEIADVNAGTSGSETSMRAPVIQELMGGTGPQPPAGTAPAAPTSAPAPQDGASEAEEDKGALTGATAVNWGYSLTDYLRSTGAMAESGMDYDDDEDIFGHEDPYDRDPDDERDHNRDLARQMADEASGHSPRTMHDVMRREVDMAHRYHDEQYRDDVHEYGREYADLIHGRGAHAHTGASTLDQIQQTTAPDGVTSRPTPMPEAVAFPWDPNMGPNNENEAPPADGEMAQGAAMTTGQAAYGRQASRVTADQWHGQEGTWHPEVQPDAANNPGTTPIPPTGSAEAGRAAAAADSAAYDTAPTWGDGSSAVPDEVAAYSQAYTGAPRPAPNVPPSLSGPPTHPRLSWALSTPAERAHPDYAAGYLAGSTWKAAAAVPQFGSQQYEAGLYAGILDNPGAQGAFHAAASTSPAAQQRIARHASVSAHLVDSGRVGGAHLVGPYLRATAGTSTDLDTMAPGTSADPSGNTPFNGPGRPGPLDGQYGAAEPGGPSPYQGAEPFGAPVVPSPTDTSAPALVPDTGMTTPNRAEAFRRHVQANLARHALGAPLLPNRDGSQS